MVGLKYFSDRAGVVTHAEQFDTAWISGAEIDHNRVTGALHVEVNPLAALMENGQSLFPIEVVGGGVVEKIPA